MGTTFQNNPFVIDYLLAGKDGSDDYYTFVIGTPCYVGTDAQSNAYRVIPVTDSSAHKAVCLAASITAELDAQDKDTMSVVAFPLVILTDNVKSGTEPLPAIDMQVFLEDDGSWSNNDGGSASNHYGDALGYDSGSGMYLLVLHGAVEA